MEIVNSLWVEKYRPLVLEDLVIPDEYRTELSSFIAKKEIGNLLLAGQPGSGKTTLAKIIASDKGVLLNPKDNLLAINGSSKETRGINFVSDVIEPYLKIPPMGQDKYKIVFIDEADFLTDASFHSMRNIIEKYSKYCRWIFTCNYLSKIPEALQSRFQCYLFKKIPIEFVVEYCVDILKKESIDYNADDVKFMVDNLYPDIRRILNSMQRSSIDSNLTINRDALLTNERIVLASYLEIIDALTQKDFNKINKPISTIVKVFEEHQDLEFRNVYESLFDHKNVPAPAKIVVNKHANSHGACLVPAMHFMSMIYETIEVIKKYQELTGK